ncbi:MAG: MurR/RpiR family transcriptional regulator [Anaerolineae bacterium]|nr:MurR/RpiR family transcriptional regulator [Anaerolineae bacterium]
MFREKIKQAYETLTPSFKRLGKFILNNELEVAFMTATELAQAMDVDAATVVRFSQTVGYRGYRELAKELRETVRQDLQATYVDLDKAKTVTEKLQALLENERSNLGIAVAQVTDHAAEIVTLLARAKRVWIIGEASGQYLAPYFASHLRAAGINANAVDADPAEAAWALWELGEKDLVVGLGVSGTGLDTAAALRFARERGAATAALSVSAVAPPAQVAEHVLVCASSTPVGVPSDASLVTLMLVLWQALLARKKNLDPHVAGLQKAFSDLLTARAEQNDWVDIEQFLREY